MKPFMLGVYTLLSTFFICAQTGAGEIDDRWYVAPAVSYIKADKDRKSDNGPGISLGVGKAITESWDIEANLVADDLDAKNSSNKYKQKGLGLDALYFFDRDPSFAPYAVMGAGVLSTKKVDESTNGMANVGLGFKKELTDIGLSLRADARYRADFDDFAVANQKRFGDWVLNLGLVIPLGDKANPAPVAVAAAVEPPAKPMDSDGDGIVDSKDRCPNTPAGAKVNEQGCELDSDGDGIVDSKDRCPNSPAGAKVNEQGCELDSDGDGIVDSMDRCPDSKAGAKVDNNGCEIPEVIILKGVNFETSSDRLTSESTGILNGVADSLSSHPEIAVEVAGYTDNRGSASLNEKLSQKRAQAVVNYLIGRGVKAENLTAKGYGAANPIADNTSVKGRAINRRVELHITRK